VLVQDGVVLFGTIRRDRRVGGISRFRRVSGVSRVSRVDKASRVSKVSRVKHGQQRETHTIINVRKIINPVANKNMF
jgi:hypothetical protein